ncbi:phage tail tape measure protein [Denitromonas halophila]|uniref:Phage tail tape measure protein n=1 Tax=Denitromonas halophila TaxID=1629404 RepID=A0A557QX78_9RHOO|nr:phage tail tape measure protein [Denitromonas halophila]TVO57522.1 phage tail tape measure protein [Denitromonas halophila]
MSNNLEFSLVMRLRDQASKQVERGMRDMRTAVGQSDRAVNQLGRSMLEYERNTKRAERESRGLLGTVRRMANERGPVALVNTLRAVVDNGGSAVRVLGRMRDLAAGAAAGAYVVGRPLGQTMDYGMRLAGMANTAFSGRDTLGRIAGKRELDAAIVRAVRQGGGTRDSAAETLDTLIASGAMPVSDAMRQLPTLMRKATASGAAPTELANIGIRGMQTFGIAPDQIGRAIDMAITAGQAGGFELRDMARWLPQQMAAGRLSGLNGIDGLAKILAANQASAITAGTKDEAGNNLVNLLAKINSRETALDAKKMGIDLPGTLSAARGKGMDSLDAFVALARQMADANPEFKRLQSQLAGAPAGDKRTLLASQADILQGSSLGALVQDRQAMMALVALMNNGGYMADVQRQVMAGGGAGEANFAVIAQEAGFKTQQAANEAAIASNTAFEKLAPAVGDAAEKLTEYAREYPGLTAALSAATKGLTALAVASGAAGLSGMLRGGAAAGAAGAAGGLGSRLLTKLGVTGAFAGGASLTQMASLGATGIGTIAGGVGIAGAAGYGAGTLINKTMIEGTEFGDSIGRGVAKALAFFGNEDAKRAVEAEARYMEMMAAQSQTINIQVDGRTIATVVNDRNAREASRN